METNTLTLSKKEFASLTGYRVSTINKLTEAGKITALDVLTAYNLIYDKTRRKMKNEFFSLSFLSNSIFVSLLYVATDTPFSARRVSRAQGDFFDRASLHALTHIQENGYELPTFPPESEPTRRVYTFDEVNEIFPTKTPEIETFLSKLSIEIGFYFDGVNGYQAALYSAAAVNEFARKLTKNKVIDIW